MQTLKNQPAKLPQATVAASLFEVSKLYGSFAALRKVSVEFAVGSSTVILGDNGAGKSTLLRLLAGLIAPSRGTLRVFGEEPRNRRRRIAYMSHDSMLYEELSAIENLRYFASLHRDRQIACSCTASSPSSRSPATPTVTPARATPTPITPTSSASMCSSAGAACTPTSTRCSCGRRVRSAGARRR